MKSFFKTLFASTLGVIIGITFIGFITMMIFTAIIASSNSSTYDLKDKTILTLDLDGTLNDREDTNPFAAIFGESNSGLDDMLNAIKKAKENDKIKGIYIKNGNLYAGIAALEPIRNALLDFKQTGKFVVAYADNYWQNTYYVASVADKVIMNPKGMFDFHGLSANPVFVRGFYEKLGVKYQVFKVGTFKSAVEPYIQDKMSDANRLQTSAFLNDVWGHLVTGISGSRNISVEDLNRYADENMMFKDAEVMVQNRLVDTLMYAPNVNKYLMNLIDIEQEKDLRMATVKNMTTVPYKEKNNSKEKIAVLYAEGSIVDDTYTAGPFGSQSFITAKKYVKELQKLGEDENVKAVVFRVNSGGGSAYASEQIWNAVVELKAKKPVVVSMGDYAASGGYYISCAADAIVAEPTTLTGSIGIFGLIPEGEELAKKMGLSFDEVKTHRFGSLGGTTFGIPFLVSACSRKFTPEEMEMFQKYVEKGYDLFITRCADGRSKTKAEIDSIGQGRVWTGNQALQIGLVDKLGGVEDAIKIAAEKANVENYRVANYPAKKDFFTQLMEQSMTNTKAKSLKIFMGEKEYDQHMFKQNMQSFDAMMAIMSETISY